MHLGILYIQVIRTVDIFLSFQNASFNTTHTLLAFFHDLIVHINMTDKVSRPSTSSRGEKLNAHTGVADNPPFNRETCLEVVIFLLSEAQRYQSGPETVMEQQCHDKCWKASQTAMYGTWWSPTDVNSLAEEAWYYKQVVRYDRDRRIEHERRQLRRKSMSETVRDLVRMAIEQLKMTMLKTDTRCRELGGIVESIEMDVRGYMEFHARPPAWDAYARRIYQLFPEANQIFKNEQADSV